MCQNARLGVQPCIVVEIVLPAPTQCLQGGANAQEKEINVRAAARCPIDLEHARTASLKFSMMLEPAQHHPAMGPMALHGEMLRLHMHHAPPMVITMLYEVSPGVVDANTLFAKVLFLFFHYLFCPTWGRRSPRCYFSHIARPFSTIDVKVCVKHEISVFFFFSL